ncbi:MAG: hypothetical protein E7523_05615 [Ruminococcaceae bacterium]|nr:hypothetical protein [Oscillospiraceae bacterium]
MRTKIKNTTFVSVVFILIMLFSVSVYATVDNTVANGKLFEFGKDDHYEFSASDTFTSTDEADTYGDFAVNGNIADISSKDGVPSYEVSEGNLSVFYNYTDAVLNADVDSWHLYEDKSKKLNDLELDSNILKGAIIVQTSKDRLNWVNQSVTLNAFADVPVRTDAIYETTDVELLNGCFYRILVAYELRIRTEENKVLFVNADKYDYKKCVEVYEFYAFVDNGEIATETEQQSYNLGSKVKTENFDGYYGEQTLEAKDIHYGWDLGQFFVSGYTSRTEKDGTVVFLKNVGDKVTLWFRLAQNINALNGKDTLKITADPEGYDQAMETPRTDFGHGALIIRYTDYNNVKQEPTIYTNYLEANTSVGADTKVQLFEEGDYEIALDYQVTDDQLIDKIGHYRIAFKFSVRNGNCMAYPFDLQTGSELPNGAITENGFRLDLAKSRYLKINLKREVLTESADGLTEDTRFNGPAKDGAEYTQEGIYTITVQNEYTNQLTVKKIYVGTNDVLKAYIATGLSIPEINNLIADGATIAADGTIQLAPAKNGDATPSEEATFVIEQTDEVVQPEKDNSYMKFVLPAVAGFLLCFIIATAIMKKNNKKTDIIPDPEEQEDNQRGEQA